MQYELESVPQRYRLKVVWTWVDGLVFGLGGLIGIGLLLSLAGSL